MHVSSGLVVGSSLHACVSGRGGRGCVRALVRKAIYNLRVCRESEPRVNHVVTVKKKRLERLSVRGGVRRRPENLVSTVFLLPPPFE